MATREHGNSRTAARILDAAERLVQDRGFNGFSYADVAAELQITKPALHYDFASKADLGEALIARYAAATRPGPRTARARDDMGCSGGGAASGYFQANTGCSKCDTLIVRPCRATWQN